MPKKPQKTKEEKLAEDFFPVDSDDLKHTTEKQIKEAKPEAPKHSIIEKSHKNLELEKIEKIETNTLKIKRLRADYHRKTSGSAEDCPGVGKRKTILLQQSTLL